MLRQITYKYNIYTSTVRCSVQGAQALIQEFRGGGGGERGDVPPPAARARNIFLLKADILCRQNARRITDR